MNLKTKIIILVTAIGLGYGFGRYLQPEKVITKKEVVEVAVEKERVEYRTIVRYITKKDGTTVKEEIKEEIKEKESVDTKKTKKERIVINVKPQWRVQAQANLSTMDDVPQYKVGVERRIAGPIFVGAYSSTDFKEYGILLSMEF